MASIRPRKWTTEEGNERSGWEVSWYDSAGKRKKKLFSGPGAQAKARLKRTDIEGELRAMPPIGDGKLAVGAAGDKWVAHIKALGRERTTWESYEQHLRDHIKPTMIIRPGREDDGAVPFGEIVVSGLRAPDCEALKDALIEKISLKLTAKVMGSLRMLLNDVVRRGAAAGNVAAAVRVRQVDRGEGGVEIPSRAELKAILRAARAPEPAPVTFATAWVTMTTFCGLRPSENRGAAIEDLVLEGKSPGIHVRRRADERNKIGKVKSRSGRRFVPFGPAVVATLRRWILAVPRKAGFEDPEHKGKMLHPLFPTSIGTVQTLANIYNRMWVPLMIAADLVAWLPVLDADGQPAVDEDGNPLARPKPRYSLNCLRHVAASLMIEEGLDAKTIQVRMGHSSVKVTLDLYGHLFAEREFDGGMMEKIEGRLL